MLREKSDVPPGLFPSGCLLHGPPGVGKTHMVRELVKEFAARHPTKMFIINPSAVYAVSTLGASEKYVRGTFAAARAFAGESGGVAVLFFDEIDALCPVRSRGTEREARVVGQILMS